MLANALLALAAGASGVRAAKLDRRATTTPAPTVTLTDDAAFFQTEPASYQGTTATGIPALLAEINPGPFQAQYDPSNPVQTSEPISGANGRNIFHLMGALSPYFVPEEGFGVAEYALPKGSEIKQVFMVHRHGSRYPSDQEATPVFSQKIVNATAHGVKFTGALEFLNDFSADPGINILVAKGRQELFESGVQHYYNYGALFNQNASHKLVVRSTTVDRAVKSAENFLAGMIGLDWKEYANILTMISGSGFNSSLTGIGNCPNSLPVLMNLENDAVIEWQNTYLKERTAWLSQFAPGFNWTVEDSYNAQSLCAYQTITAGYSELCQLFTYKEWEGFGYAGSIVSSSYGGFMSPVGRAAGIAWVEEFIARVQGHLLDSDPGTTNANRTQDTNPVTFPLDQGMYLDFGHDSSILGALTAFGFKQFAGVLPATGPAPGQGFVVSNITPFAARLVIEIIDAPHVVKPVRSCDEGNGPYDFSTGKTSYVHFILNQRTIPLHTSFPECPYRDDGWCDLQTFLKIAQESIGKAQFEFSCFGNWTMGPYGSVTDGVPVAQ